MIRTLKDHFLPHNGNDHHPKLLRHRHLLAMSFGLVALKIFAVGVAMALPEAPAASRAIAVTTLVELTNQTRADMGLPLLQADPRLNEAAQNKADDMARLGYFAHTSPSGTTAFDFILAQGYRAKYAAENLAMRYSQVEAVQRGWLLSSTHRSNIVNPRYRDIGIGISNGAVDGKNGIMVVQLFGTPYAQAAERATSTQPVIAKTNTTSETVQNGLRTAYVAFIVFLTVLLLLMISVRFRRRHAAAAAHGLAVIGLAFVLMLV